jgi:hypothetical protein
MVQKVLQNLTETETRYYMNDLPYVSIHIYIFPSVINPRAGYAIFNMNRRRGCQGLIIRG